MVGDEEKLKLMLRFYPIQTVTMLSKIISHARKQNRLKGNLRRARCDCSLASLYPRTLRQLLGYKKI